MSKAWLLDRKSNLFGARYLRKAPGTKQKDSANPINMSSVLLQLLKWARDLGVKLYLRHRPLKVIITSISIKKERNFVSPKIPSKKLNLFYRYSLNLWECLEDICLAHYIIVTVWFTFPFMTSMFQRCQYISDKHQFIFNSWNLCFVFVIVLKMFSWPFVDSQKPNIIN